MALQAPMNRIARLIPPSTAKLVKMKSGTPSATARRVDVRRPSHPR
jgi:hypothetical protein